MKKVSALIIVLFITLGSAISQKKNQGIPSFNVEQAEVCIRDYYSFYHTDFLFSELKVRKIAKNTFYVSLKEKFRSPDDIDIEGNYISSKSNNTNILWSSKLFKLKIKTLKKYTLEDITHL